MEKVRRNVDGKRRRFAIQEKGNYAEIYSKKDQAVAEGVSVMPGVDGINWIQPGQLLPVYSAAGVLMDELGKRGSSGVPAAQANSGDGAGEDLTDAQGDATTARQPGRDMGDEVGSLGPRRSGQPQGPPPAGTEREPTDTVVLGRGREELPDLLAGMYDPSGRRVDRRPVFQSAHLLEEPPAEGAPPTGQTPPPPEGKGWAMTLNLLQRFATQAWASPEEFTSAGPLAWPEQPLPPGQPSAQEQTPAAQLPAEGALVPARPGPETQTPAAALPQLTAEQPAAEPVGDSVKLLPPVLPDAPAQDAALPTEQTDQAAQAGPARAPSQPPLPDVRSAGEPQEAQTTRSPGAADRSIPFLGGPERQSGGTAAPRPTGMAGLERLKELPFSLYLFGHEGPWRPRREDEEEPGAQGENPARREPGEYYRLSEVIRAAVLVHSAYHGTGKEFPQEVPWHGPYVRYALGAGLLRTGELVDVNAFATRGQTALIYARCLPAAELLPVNLTAPPPGLERGRYGAGLLLLWRAGVLPAAGTAYRADDLITRAEASAIMGRIVNPAYRKASAYFSIGGES